MSSYLLIESRDPYESGDTQHIIDLAKNLKNNGHDVAVILVSNGVLPARRQSHHPQLDDLIKNEITVLADNFSLRERGIGHDALKPGIHAAEIDVVVDHLAQGTKVIWH